MSSSFTQVNSLAPRQRLKQSRLNMPHHRQMMRKTLPIQSYDEYRAQQKHWENNSDKYGGYSGCAYRGVPFGDAGVVCARNINKYFPRTDSFQDHFVSNADVRFPSAVVDAPGGISQLLMGGGPGNTPCEQLCECTPANPECSCKDSPQKCGWETVNHDCMGAVPNGTYASLSACEAASNTGRFGR